MDFSAQDADPIPDQTSTSSEESDKVKIRSFLDILKIIKPFGLWQIQIYLLIAILQFFHSMVNTAVVFYQVKAN